MKIPFVYDNYYRLGEDKELYCGKTSKKPFILNPAYFRNYCFDTCFLPLTVCIKNNIPFVYTLNLNDYLDTSSTTTKDDISNAFSTLNKDVLEFVRNNKALLMFYEKQPLDNLHQVQSFNTLHTLATALKIKPQSIIYLTDNLLAESSYLKSFSSKRNKLCVVNNDIAFSYVYKTLYDRADVDRYPTNKMLEKTFLSLNKKATSSALSVIDDINKNNLLSESIISLPLPTDITKTNYLFAKKLPLIVDTYDFSKISDFDIDMSLYDKTLVSILINENTNNDVMYIPKKIIKEMYMVHPFIVFGNPGILLKLKDYGLRSFSPIINEKYDAETDTEKRKQLIVHELKRLSTFPAFQKKHIAGIMKAITLTNKQYLDDLTGKFGKKIHDQFVKVVSKNKDIRNRFGL